MSTACEELARGRIPTTIPEMCKNMPVLFYIIGLDNLTVEFFNKIIKTSGFKFRERINDTDASGRTILHCALCNVKCPGQVVNLIIANGANVNAKDNSGKTPLHYAA